MLTPQRYFKSSQVIDSMRDNGYKDTAYAVAELIDNSIQAGARTVRFICLEKVELVNDQNRKRIQKIAILDDGIGMDEKSLYKALAFGESTHRDDPDGMGKFGMGLPNSSISQCRKTEVWSWKNGATPLYTFLDIEAIKKDNQEDIPFPRAKPLDEFVKNAYRGNIPSSGTVVVWSDLDRLRWKTSAALLKHTESLIGRMYRYMIKHKDENKAVRIVFETYAFNKNSKIYEREGDSITFKPNDPMYLMKGTTVEGLNDFPSQFVDQAIFDLNRDDRKEIVLSDGTKGFFIIRTSSVKKEFMDAMIDKTRQKVGSTQVGKHFASNIGLSIIRAGRELDLKRDFKIKDNYNKDRYIGVEVYFSPSLDNFFGVTNNKQSATKIQTINLSDVALQEGIADETNVIEEMKIRDPDYGLYLECMSNIERAFNVFDELKVKGISYGSDKSLVSNRIDDSATEIATIIEGERSATHPISGEDGVDNTPTPDDLKDGLEGLSYTPKELDELINEVISKNIKVKFDERSGPKTSFFDISIIQGFTLIQINTEHNFYKNFLSKASERDKMLLKLCLAAWGRMVKEAPGEKAEAKYKYAREQWGIMLDEYLDLDFDEI